jgi:hypothetical protein
VCTPCDEQMSFKEGVVMEYSPGRDRSLEPLLEGLIKAGTYIDEAMFTLRSNDPEKSIYLPDDDVKNAKLMVTNHFLERPKSGHSRVVKVITQQGRIGKFWPEFEQQPADNFYENTTSLDTTTIIENILNLTPKALLYCINSSHDKIVEKITYNKVFSITQCYGLLRYLRRSEGINTTTVYVGNVGTLAVGHNEDGNCFSRNQMINEGKPNSTLIV